MKEELRKLLEEKVITNIEESNQDYTEKEEHSTTWSTWLQRSWSLLGILSGIIRNIASFPAVRTEPAKRMMRCNPPLGAGEKPSPSQSDVALPVPENHTKTKSRKMSTLQPRKAPSKEDDEV